MHSVYCTLLRDPLYNSGEDVANESEWTAKFFIEANSWAIGEKSNAAERPSPADHRPQGVMQRVLNVRLAIQFLLPILPDCPGVPS